VGDIPVAKPSPIPRKLRFPRRGLAIALVLAGFVALAAVIAIAAYPSGSKVDQVTGPHWVTVARADDLQVGQPVHVFDQKFWLVKLDSGEVLALSHKDSRGGCTIPWRPDFQFNGHKGWFRDPCSGSTYNIEGIKAFGPSPRNMDRFTVRVYGNDVQVMMADGQALPTPAPPAITIRP
jgi:hypothetical protein